MSQADNYQLGIILKNWAARVHPPGQARARLLWLAAQTSPETDRPDEIQLSPRSRPYPSFNWSGYLMTWNPDHSFQASLPVTYSLV